jgi:hypothetical protein
MTEVKYILGKNPKNNKFTWARLPILLQLLIKLDLTEKKGHETKPEEQEGS